MSLEQVTDWMVFGLAISSVGMFVIIDLWRPDHPRRRLMIAAAAVMFVALLAVIGYRFRELGYDQQQQDTIDDRARPHLVDSQRV